MGRAVAGPFWVTSFSAPWTVTDANAGHLAALAPSVFFHARPKLAESLVAGRFKLLGAFADYAARQGRGVEVLHTSEASRGLIDARQHLHVFMDDRPVFAPNCFHCVPAYLRGYWYFDELATRNNSSIRLLPFNPRPMSQSFADRFHEKLVEQFVLTNFSKYAQADRGADIQVGCLAFFAQDFRPPRDYPDYMTAHDMIGAAIAAKGARALYIKAHPNQPEADIAQLRAYHAPENGVYFTQASIHDLLAAADVVLTLSSAVGFEAFLHKTPVILAAQTDFWHNAVTLTDPAHMAGAVTAALGRHWPYAKYLTWFLHHNCIADRAAALPELLRRVHRKGFRFADMGEQGFF